MAYDSAVAQPIRIGGSVSGPSILYYRSADIDSDVIAANYVTDADDLGMAVGDVVHIWDTTTNSGKGSTAWVSAVASTGSTMIFTVIA